MALLAFAAVFVVFKLQILTGVLQAKEKEIILCAQQWFSQSTGVIPDDIRLALQNISGFNEWIEIKLSDKKYTPRYRNALASFSKMPDVNYLFNEHKYIISQQSQVILRMRFPFLSVLLVIIVSLLLLPFATAIHSVPILELSLFITMIIFNIASLVINTRFVFNVLRNQ
jgi:hypothetical protein